MSHLEALLFDVFGTLVDWRGSVLDEAVAAGARAGVEADWAAVVDDWRRAYRPTLERARAEPGWRDLDALQRESLADVLAEHGADELPEAEREVLVWAWRRLRPWPDTRSGLDRLRAPSHSHAIERPRCAARRPAPVRRPARRRRAVRRARRQLQA